jgi:hypothetical protein
LLFRRRRPLPSFWLHSIVVYKNIEFRLSFARTLWLPPVTLGAYMSSGNLLRIGFRVLPSFRWIHWVGYSTRTMLRRWGVITNFTLLSLLFPLISVLPTGNPITIG